MNTKAHRFIRSLLFVGLSAWTCLSNLRAQQINGGDIAFLSGTAPTIDGVISPGEWSDACLTETGDQLAALPDGSSLASLSLGNVRVYTKRDNTAFYFCFDVDDSTNPNAASIGDRVIVILDPNQHLGTHPAVGDYRLEYTTFRGSAGADITQWFKGTGTTWQLDASAPMYTVARQNRSGGTPGYVVEIKIPFAAVGYALSSATPADIGIAFAVVNDMGFTHDYNNGDGPVEILSGIGFPNTSTLPLDTNQNVLVDLSGAVHGPWDNPSNWGTGTLSGGGQMVYISGNPYKWASEDIKVAFTNAVDFADAGNPGDAKWYRYKETAPCTLRVWAKAHRNAPGVGDIKRRFLLLWAEHGSDPQHWTFVGLSDPVVMGPAPVDVICPAIDWSSVPAGQPNHPCLRVFILPENLNAPGKGISYFQGLGASAANNATEITAFMTAYNLTDAHWAQMNIEHVSGSPFSCPGYTQPQMLIKQKMNGASERIMDKGPAKVNFLETLEGRLTLNFSVYGVVPKTSASQHYVFVESRGGVAEVYNRKELKIQDGNLIALPSRVHFNVSNGPDAPRRLFVNTQVLGASDLKPVSVLPLVAPELLGVNANPMAPGATVAVNDVTVASAPVGKVVSSCCASMGVKSSATSAVLLGMIGVVIFLPRRKGNKQP